MHARAVVPEEERLLFLGIPFNEIHGVRVNFFVDGFHPLRGQRAGIFDGLATLAVRFRVQHTAWTILLAEFGVLWIVIGFRFFFGIQVVEVSEEFIEAVQRWQVLILVTQVVLPELTRCITLFFEQVGDGWSPVRNTMRTAGHPDRQQACTEWMLSENE